MIVNSFWNKIKSNAYKVLNPIKNLLKRTGIMPNGITTIGLIINILSAGILIIGAEVGKRGDFRYIAKC